MINFRQMATLQVHKLINILQRVVIKIKALDGTTVTILSHELGNWLSSSSRLVTLTAASSMTREANGNGKINLLSLLAGFDTTLPAATGSGDTYIFQIGLVNTSNDYGILALTTDTLSGVAFILDSDTGDNVVGFLADGTDDKIEMDGTTTGGLTIGDRIEFIDTASTTWTVRAYLTGSGTVATPFAAT
jgi:hypothetical protein